MNILRFFRDFFSRSKVAPQAAVTGERGRVAPLDPLAEFEKKICDEKNTLFEIKSDLAKVLADEMGMIREVEELDERIRVHENSITKALGNKDEKLAVELSEQIALAINDKSKILKLLDAIRAHTKTIKTIISEKESNIKTAEFEISSIRTMANIQTISSNLSASFSADNLGNSDAMLDKLRLKWLKQQDYTNALIELQSEQDEDLLDKLRAKGIHIGEIPSEEILNNLKEKYHGNVK